MDESRERKRERDKNAQRRKRDRERAVFLNLERRNADLEKQVLALHDGAGSNVQNLSDAVDSLRVRNEELSQRLSRVDDFVSSWTMQRRQDWVEGNQERRVDLLCSQTNISRLTDLLSLNTSVPSGSQSPNTSFDSKSPQHLMTSEMVLHSNLIADPPRSEPPVGSPELTVSISLLENALSLPLWRRLPLNLSTIPCFDPFGAAIVQMKRSSEQFAKCGLEPSALDLASGSSGNLLANVIFESINPHPLRRTEKVGIQWICYLMARWRIEPTRENFERMPTSYHPTARQLFTPHAPIFDYVLWPQMRDNFVKHGTKYCREEVFGLLFCTCRVRDTPNSDFLIRNTSSGSGGNGEENVYQVDPAFAHRITQVENWVLLDKFWIEYPELVEGMDRESIMISEKDLV